MALAATTVLVLGTVTLRVRLTPWTVTTVEGDVRIGGQVAGSTAPVQDGQLIETAERSKALLQVGIIGQVEIDEGSRLRIVTTNRREHRLGLERGRISAVISAPPRWFTVDTPAAAAIDLGCAYTLEVDQAGFGTLRVQEGWVQLDGGAYEAIVPEQAMTHMRTGRGPGSPHYQDASDGFREALSIVDFGRDDEVLAAVPTLLAVARPRDSLTLLSLWRRLGSVGRGQRRSGPSLRPSRRVSTTPSGRDACTHRLRVVSRIRRQSFDYEFQTPTRLEIDLPWLEAMQLIDAA